VRVNAAPELRILARAVAALAVVVLIAGTQLAAGTTTIGPVTVVAHFGSDAQALIMLCALGVAAVVWVGTRTDSHLMAWFAAAAAAGAGLGALAEVRRCVEHWHASASQAAAASGYGQLGAQNRYGHGVEVVVAGGVIAIAAALVLALAGGARTPLAEPS
jgi:hypothetical protein